MTRNYTVRLVFTAVLLFLQLSAWAQDSSKYAGTGFEANYFEGKVFKHTYKFRLPIPERSLGIDINLVQHTTGRRDWQQRRGYPTIGLGFTYTNYGIDSVYGRCFSIYPNITIPLVTGDKFEWTLRIGDGAGYATRDYSRKNPVDTLNNAIGSHINDYASLMMDLRWHVNIHWDVQLGGNFSHISNASYHQPNLGINMYGAHLGVRFFPVTSVPRHIVKALPRLKNRWLAQLRLTMGMDQSYAPHGPSYPVYLATGYASKRWLGKNKLLLGADYSYHPAIYEYLRNNSFVPDNQIAGNAYKAAVFVGNEFLMGKRIGLLLQAGYYVHQAFLTTVPYYEKLGIDLYLVQQEHGPVKEFFLCGYLKANSTTAELAEFGLGMGF